LVLGFGLFWGVRNDTVGSSRRWPGHARVNHNKYIVTDTVANIATSNMAWSYFATTVGASINIEDEKVAESLEQIFDRDWHSEYAAPIA
jgi:phospholipase D3/4